MSQRRAFFGASSRHHGGAFALAMTLVAVGCGGGSAKPAATPMAPEIAVTPAGTARGDAIEMMVPPTGGKLMSADGRLTVDVPADALAAALTLSLQPIMNEAPGGVGVAYRLGPDGTTFAKPVTLTFSYTDADLVGSEAPTLDVGYQDGMGQWNAVKAATRDEVGKTISVATTHFSDWSMLEGFQLRPATSTVPPRGMVELAAYACSNRVAGTDELAELRYKCRPDPELFVVDQWAANGAAGGNPTVGTFTIYDETTATFNAPAQAPANNPISVSAATTDKTTARKTVLVANVFVADHPKLMGTVTSKQTADPGLTITTRADVKFVWDEADQWYQLDPSSTVTAHWDIEGTMCQTHGIFTKNLAPEDATIIILELGYFPTGKVTGTFVGTSSCGGGAPEPFMLEKEIEWWPSPVDSLLAVKPNGSLDDGFVDRLLASGALVSAEWLLTPVAQ